MKAAGFVKLFFGLVLLAHSLQKPPQPPMNIHVIRSQLGSRIQLTQCVSLPTAVGIQNPQVQMRQRQSRINLRHSLQQR